MKKVLITGATGATGGNAIKKLLELKVPVRALVHKVDERSEKLSSQGVEIVRGDLSDFEALSEALQGITVAALSRIAPREVPRAVGRLHHFLRASFDQHERALVPLQEELAIVGMYLDIEILRFGSRLKVERAIDPGLLEVLLPPFSLQPLVENAV